MQETKRAVGYVRVSRSDENPENQEYVIREYCHENNLDCFIFPAEIEIARTTDPFTRPLFKQVVSFMEKNGIGILIVESIDRLTADPKHWEKLITFFTERGWRIVFVKDADITTAFETAVNLLENVKKSADSEVVRQVLEHQKKQLLDLVKLYWKIKVAIAKDYVEDVRRKVIRAMERLKNEGRVYTKPTLVTYYALFITGKHEFPELTPEDIEKAEKLFYTRYVKPFIDGMPVRRLWRRFIEEEKPFISFLDTISAKRIPRKPRKNSPNKYYSYTTFYTNLVRLAKKYGKQ